MFDLNSAQPRGDGFNCLRWGIIQCISVITGVGSSLVMTIYTYMLFMFMYRDGKSCVAGFLSRADLLLVHKLTELFRIELEKNELGSFSVWWACIQPTWYHKYGCDNLYHAYLQLIGIDKIPYLITLTTRLWKNCGRPLNLFYTRLAVFHETVL